MAKKLNDEGNYTQLTVYHKKTKNENQPKHSKIRSLNYRSHSTNTAAKRKRNRLFFYIQKPKRYKVSHKNGCRQR